MSPQKPGQRGEPRNRREPWVVNTGLAPQCVTEALRSGAFGACPTLTLPLCLEFRPEPPFARSRRPPDRLVSQFLVFVTILRPQHDRLMPTVLIAPASLRGKPGPFREILKAAGFDVFIDPKGEDTLLDAELRDVLPTCDAMVAGGEKISASLLDLCPKLRAISRTGVGYDAIDVAACTARKIAVTITPGTNQESVAEHTFALLLALTRSIVSNDVQIKSGGWNRALVAPIRGKTLGIVGMGRIGRAVTTRALAFGMRVVAYDPMPDHEFDTRHGVTRLSFRELLAASDIVTLHLPLIPETQGLINRNTLAMMRPGSILINTARGGLVVETDLRDSLLSGHLAGAGLDVLNHEPPEHENPLIGLKNVVVSPHLGGIDTKGMADMADMAAGCIAGLKEGRWPAGCVVNVSLKEGWTWNL